MGSKYDPLRVNVTKLKPGEAFVATQGEDFICKPESFRQVVYSLASHKGNGWKGTASVVGHSVVYCFFREFDFMRPNLPAYPIVLKLRGEL